MINKKLFQISLFGIGMSLLLISIKESIAGRILAVLAIIIFIYMFLKS